MWFVFPFALVLGMLDVIRAGDRLFGMPKENRKSRESRTENRSRPD